MKAAVGAIAACIGVFAAFLLQQSLPAIHVLHGARFVFVPMIFCYAAIQVIEQHSKWCFRLPRSGM